MRFRIFGVGFCPRPCVPRHTIQNMSRMFGALGSHAEEFCAFSDTVLMVGVFGSEVHVKQSKVKGK